MKEIKGLKSQIKQELAQVSGTFKKALSSIDMTEISNKAIKAIRLVKKEVDNLKKANKNNELAIKVNNKDAEKQIGQTQKSLDSLKKQTTGRNI